MSYKHYFLLTVFYSKFTDCACAKNKALLKITFEDRDTEF